jgi:hypothetical protein
MNGGTKAGFGTISLERLQCVRRDSVGPTERRRRRKRPVREVDSPSRSEITNEWYVLVLNYRSSDQCPC